MSPKGQLQYHATVTILTRRSSRLFIGVSMRSLSLALAIMLLAACAESQDATPTPDAPGATESAATATTAPSATNTAAAPTAPASTPQAGVEIILVAAYGGPPGGNAYVEARVTPGAVCDLSYTTPAGTPSEAEGLEEKAADANGDVRWDWSISAGTNPGQGDVTVTCGDASQTVHITIG